MKKRVHHAYDDSLAKVRAELFAMPSVQDVKQAAVALSRSLYELGGIRRIESLTLQEIEHLAHAALFAKINAKDKK